MKGISYITDNYHKMKAVIIELKTLEKYEEQIEDLLDIIISESRKDEAKIPIEEVKRQLKMTGKL